MLYIVEATRHRTGRARIVFGDDSSRRAGRDFLRRLVKAGGSVRAYEEAGIPFPDLWSFDFFRLEDPRAAGFATWQGKNDAVQRLAEQCRQTAAGIRQVLGLKVGPLRPIRLDEKYKPILDDEGKPVFGDEGSVLNRIFVPPWPPSLGRKLPAIAEDLDALAGTLGAAVPVLRRPPHAPPKERDREFRLGWDRLARERSGGPLDRLGAVLFNAVFDKAVGPANFKRQRQDDRRRKKLRNTARLSSS